MRAWCGLAELAAQPVPLPDCFAGGDPLTEDRRHQLVEQHLAGAEADVGMVSLGTKHSRMGVEELEARVECAGHRRRRVAASSPCPSPHASASTCSSFHPIRSVAGPSGVNEARQNSPDAETGRRVVATEAIRRQTPGDRLVTARRADTFRHETTVASRCDTGTSIVSAGEH